MGKVPEDLLRAFGQKAAEQAERAQLLSRRLEQNTASVESPGGEIRLTVDANGGLARLEFGAAAERLSLDRLADLVLQTSRRAQAELADSMNDLVSGIYGSDSSTTRFVSETYHEKFPRPDNDDEATAR